MTTNVDLDALERQLEEAIACVVAQGWTIKDGLTRDDESKFCCPIGAVEICAGGSEQRLRNIGRARLGILPNQTYLFVIGFEGGEGSPDPTSPLRQLGRKFRRRYIKAQA